MNETSTPTRKREHPSVELDSPAQLARRRCRTRPVVLPRLVQDVLPDIAALRERCDRRFPILRVCLVDLDTLVVVGLEGTLDAAGGPSLRDRLRRVTTRTGVRVTFDCSLLSSITPEGAELLGQTIDTLRTRNDQVSVRQPNSDVLRVLRERQLFDVEVEADSA